MPVAQCLTKRCLRKRLIFFLTKGATTCLYFELLPNTYVKNSFHWYKINNKHLKTTVLGQPTNFEDESMEN